MLSELVRRAAEHAAEHASDQATDQATERASEAGATNVDTARRLPGAALRRHVEIRDRRCRGVGCRGPASSADIDHTHDHATGGPTAAANLGALCRHHHRLEHEGGWALDQPEPGFFVWTSRLGQRHEVRPSPVIESLPEPIVRDEPLPPMWVPSDRGRDRPIFDDRDPEPERGPPDVVAEPDDSAHDDSAADDAEPLF